MGPHAEMRKAGTHHTDKTVEKEGGTGEWKQQLRRVAMLDTQTLKENTDNVAKEHIESLLTHRSKCC